MDKAVTISEKELINEAHGLGLRMSALGCVGNEKELFSKMVLNHTEALKEHARDLVGALESAIPFIGYEGYGAEGSKDLAYKALDKYKENE